MIRTYWIKVDLVEGTEVVRGIEFIHHAVLDVDGVLRKLTQDTTEDEHQGLMAVAERWKKATKRDETKFLKFLELLPSEPPRNLYSEIDELKARIIEFERTVDNKKDRGSPPKS